MELKKCLNNGKFNNEERKLDKKTKIKGFIFVPDYRKYDIKNEIYNLGEGECFEDNYEIVTYKELYKFFNEKNIRDSMMSNDLFGKKYYSDFLSALESQMQDNISEKNRIEMERKFIYAIKHAN